MDPWIDELAGAMDEDPPSPDEMGLALKLAREVAHRAERKLAPLATYLAGVHAGRRLAGGGSRLEGLREAAERAVSILPAGREGEAGRGDGAA